MQSSVSYKFHSVGQGLFSTGVVRRESFPNFHWVYDCGTVSTRTHLDAAIKKYQTHCHTGNEKFIDLVTISHFDIDHINGLSKLLSHYEIGDLLLPYLPLWQRLLLISQAGTEPRARLTRFLLDPVTFIASLPEARVRRILFVAAESSGDSPTLPRNPDLPGDTPTKNEQPEIERGSNEPVRQMLRVETIDCEVLPEDDERKLDENRYRQKQSPIAVAFVAPYSSLTVSGTWEFVPYNDAHLASKATKKFRDGAAKLRKSLTEPGSEKEKAEALEKIKKLYGKTFGTKPLEKNIISLFLYAGLMKDRKLRHHMNHFWFRGNMPHQSSCAELYAGKSSLLYTGDGYIDSESRFENLYNAIGADRMDNLGVLQVMHHGSKNNWKSGIAEMFSPAFSIFSSDPYKGEKHPHQEVLRDFWAHHPVQVDKQRSATFHIHYE